MLDTANQAADGVIELALDAGAGTTPTVVAPFGVGWDSLGGLVLANNVFIVSSGFGLYWAAKPSTSGPADFCSYTNECTQGATYAVLATDGSTVYWIDGSGTKLQGCLAAPSHCPGATTYASATSIPELMTSLAWDGTRLVVATSAGGSDGTAKMYACAPSACASSPAPLVREPGVAGRIFSASDALYWVADESPPDAGVVHPYRVMRLAK